MFILFLRFYFIEQFIQFLKQETAYFEVDQSKEIKKEAPAIVLCAYYVNTQLLKEKYNLTYGTVTEGIDLIYGFEKIPDIAGRTKFDLYQEIGGLTSNGEMAPHASFYIQSKKTSFEALRDITQYTSLFEGTNLIGNISVNLTRIVTASRLGLCYKITTDELSNDTFLIDQIVFYTWLARWSLFITGKNDWHGVLNKNYGPDDYFHHTLQMGQLAIENAVQIGTVLNVNISPTTIVGLNGIEKADECVVQHLKKAKCPYVCSPIIFNYLNEWIPPCSKNEDYLCMLDYYQKTMSPELPCYDEKQKKSTKIKGDFRKDFWFVPDVDDETKWNYLELGIKHITTDLHQMEEKYILSTEDFIGTVGGSLGLFLGFSFLTFATDLIGKVFDCIHGVEKLGLPSLRVASASEASDSVSSENEESDSENVVNLKFKRGKSERRKCKQPNPKNANPGVASVGKASAGLASKAKQVPA